MCKSHYSPSSVGYYLLLNHFNFSSILIDESSLFLHSAFPKSASISCVMAPDVSSKDVGNSYDLAAFFGTDALNFISTYSNQLSDSYVMALIKLPLLDLISYNVGHFFSRLETAKRFTPTSLLLQSIQSLLPRHSLSIYTPLPHRFDPEMIIDDLRYSHFYRQCSPLKRRLFPFINVYNCLFHVLSLLFGVSIHPYKLVILRPY